MIKKLLKKLIQQEWNLGFIDNSLTDVIEGKPLQYLWVTHEFKGRWFADPFILDVTDDSYILLVEDYDYKVGYACISKLIIDRKSMKVVEAKRVLDVGTHLSFPVIIRKEDDIYVHPENSASGFLKMYKYDKISDKLEYHSIMSNLPLTDAVTIHHDGVSTMLATQATYNPNGNVLDILEIKNGKYEVVQKKMFEENIARMAGDIFTVNGQMYRPAQDCSTCYGGALLLQKLDYDGQDLECTTIRRLTSTHPKLRTGLHTFNTYKGHIVIDVHGYSHNPVLSAMFNHIRKIILR